MNIEIQKPNELKGCSSAVIIGASTLEMGEGGESLLFRLYNEIL